MGTVYCGFRELLEAALLVNVHCPCQVQGGPKKCPNLFLSGLRITSTKFDNFWHTDSQDNRIM